MRLAATLVHHSLSGFPGSVAMSIVVVGSINTDICIRVPRLAQPNETVVGHGSYTLAQGGKGANQAAAAAAAGASVALVGMVGRDDFGASATADLERRGVDCSHVERSGDHSTGLATIQVDDAGSNSICVAPGANGALSAEDVWAAEALIARSRVMLLQLEIPVAAIEAAIKVGRTHGLTIMLDPAPAPDSPLGFLGEVDILTPNEPEAAMLTGLDPTVEDAAGKMAAALAATGVGHVVMTLGALGCLVRSADGVHREPPYRVKAVDTTGAGDVFSGFLGASLARGDSLLSGVKLASVAAGLSVTRPGARSSLPKMEEVEQAV